MRGAKAFLAGLSVGAVLVGNWRSITKSTVKAGIRGGTTLRASAARAAENLADVVQEATWEMSAEGDGPAAPPPSQPAPPEPEPASAPVATASAGGNGDGTVAGREPAGLS